MSIRVAIADDHPMVREGLAAMLASEGGFEIVATAEDGAKAVAAFPAAAPDVVLSDVRMPEMDGFAMLERLKRSLPGVKVLFLAGMPLAEEESRAMREGAAGYLPKDVDQDRLSRAIRDVASGAEEFAKEVFQSAPSPLTARELDVLRLVEKGWQRDKIAATLGIGPESVKTHMKGLLAKLDSPNSTAAVAKAYSLGILRV